MTAPETTDRHVLTDYQDEAVRGLSAAIRHTLRRQVDHPDQRGALARRSGVSLLQAPTASGKTLMLGRTLEALVSTTARKLVWFWFAPFSGLVEQTKAALSDQCGALRLRDPSSDREPGAARSGDVFVATWASVAANNKDARKVRRTTESHFSLDQMIEMLRLSGFAIGVVIDEAHLNFGVGAQASADFYLQTLRPDVTLLATATPKDRKLERFADQAGVEVGNRITIARDRVVSRALNKVGLMVGTMSLREKDRDLVDHDMAALSCGWHQHQRIKARLAERGIGVVPLMLVQVADQVKGGVNPVDEAREKLRAIGVPDAAIASHTSGKPDPDFHTLAFDPSREVLIFKVAVATGFDAPRAWTLVSLRRSQDTDFGLQIVGRIMRVHPAVRPCHGQDPLLDRGYVFLTDADAQAGLDSAADRLDSVRSSINLVTDQLDFVELGTVNEASTTFTTPMPRPRAAPTTEADRQARLGSLVAQNFVPAHVQERPAEEQDQAILSGERLRDISEMDLFGGCLPIQDAPDLFRPSPQPTRGKTRRYNKRSGLDMPTHLIAEAPPSADVINSDAFNDDFAKRFVRQSSVLQQINMAITPGSVEFRDVFHHYAVETVEDIQVTLSDKLIAERGQRVFAFNNRVDSRRVKKSLVSEVRRAAVDAGYRVDDEMSVHRAINLAAMREPALFKRVLKEVQSVNLQIAPAREPIPDFIFEIDHPVRSENNIYGIVPSDLNGPETAFAQWLDSDPDGTVKWWLRNIDRKPWACNLFLPSGARFFPDFAVGVKARGSADNIALVEVKGAHIMNADESVEKIQVSHARYFSVLWVQRDGGTFNKIAYDTFSNRVLSVAPIDVLDLRRTAV